LHEIKHDGFRIVARRDAKACGSTPATATILPSASVAVAALPVHSCLIDDTFTPTDFRPHSVVQPDPQSQKLT